MVVHLVDLMVGYLVVLRAAKKGHPKESDLQGSKMAVLMVEHSVGH